VGLDGRGGVLGDEGVSMTDKEWEDGDDSALYDKGYDDGYRQAIIDRQASKKKLGKLRRETYQAPSKGKGKHSA